MTGLLHVDRLHVRYGEHAVLHDLALVMERGEFVALIGPNGSGKTTLLRAIAGIQPASAGCVRVEGHDIAREAQSARKKLGFGIAPERLPGLLSGRECLALFAAARGMSEVPETTLALAGTLDLTPMLDYRVAHYSLGTRQKLGVVLGLLGEPPLLLLDEPFNGLDPRSAFAFKRHLEARVHAGASVLLATHSLDIAERHATRVVLLIEGRLCRSWSRAELDRLRDDPRSSLERAMVEALG